MSDAKIPKGWHIAVDKKFSSRKEALAEGPDLISFPQLREHDSIKVIKRGGSAAYYLIIRENPPS